MDVAILAALVSAALFALTNNLQREAAARVPVDDGGPLRLIRRLIVNRRWLLAGLIGVLALALHAVALARGGVLAVQSVMTLGLVLALTVEARRSGRRLLPREIGGATLIGLGVATVVAVSTPAAAPTWHPLTALVCTVIVLVALGLVIDSRRSGPGPARARLLGAAAGACFAVDAVFLQQAIAVWHGPGPDWAASVRAAVGILGFLISSMVGGVAVQRAYQVAPLRCVQPAVAAAEPVTAFLVGIAVLHEGVRGGAPGFALLVIGIVGIVGGIVAGVVPHTPTVAPPTVATPTAAPPTVATQPAPAPALATAA